jgi:hypothetical protein
LSFHHTEAAPGWVRGIGVAVLVLDVAAIGLIVTVVARDAPAAAAATAIGVVVGIVVGALLVRAAIAVDVTEQQVSLAFRPIFRQVIDAREIVSVRDVNVSPASFGGTGLRVVPGGRTGLFFHGGPGVEIATADGKTYSVVVPDPAALRDAVEQARTSSAR